MKYYYREHLAGYRRMKREGKRSWGEALGHPDDFENFSSRPFLEGVLPRLKFGSDHPKVLELGCGTGPGACFLAERGFRVDASDLVPVAVEVAREIATNRNLDIHYAVMDVTEIPHIGTKYDLIVDSYCLQGIVLDSDRGRVFSAVHARLNPRGYYLISTAMYDPSRHHGEDRTVDSDSGRVFHRYDDHDIFDPQTDIQYGLFSDDELGDGPEDYEASVRVADNWYLPHRRYRTPEGLRSELEDQRFRVLLQRGEYGENVVCTRAGSSTSLLPR